MYADNCAGMPCCLATTATEAAGCYGQPRLCRATHAAAGAAPVWPTLLLWLLLLLLSFMAAMTLWSCEAALLALLLLLLVHTALGSMLALQAWQGTHCPIGEEGHEGGAEPPVQPLGPLGAYNGSQAACRVWGTWWVMDTLGNNKCVNCAYLPSACCWTHCWIDPCWLYGMQCCTCGCYVDHKMVALTCAVLHLLQKEAAQHPGLHLLLSIMSHSTTRARLAQYGCLRAVPNGLLAGAPLCMQLAPRSLTDDAHPLPSANALHLQTRFEHIQWTDEGSCQSTCMEGVAGKLQLQAQRGTGAAAPWRHPCLPDMAPATALTTSGS